MANSPRIKANPRRTMLLFLLGALLGAAGFLLVFGFAPLNPTNDLFCRGGFIEKDIQQHYAGWLFYRESPLRFPLCVAEGIDAPQGLSVAFTDSIPLFAALFRLLSPVLPATFQYFGWFTFLCFLLQGAVGALLLGLFADGVALPLIGDLLFVFSPVLWERVVRHTSLGAQFLILGTLYYYFLGRRQNRFSYRGLFFLNVLAITIHPYFLPMTFALTLALLAEWSVANRKFARPALYLAGNLAATLLAGWCLGLLGGTADGGSESLYGYFSLNLNALWNPRGVNDVAWSRLLPLQNQVGGNYDAFAYLGLGVLIALGLLCLTVALHHRRWLAEQIRRRWMFCLVCLVLTLFAISHVVTANGATLFALPLPGAAIRLFSVFRSSGRLFWPVYYLLMLSAFVGCCRVAKRLGGKWAVPAVAVLLAAIQLWDISPGLGQRQNAMRQANTSEAFPTAMASSFWQQAAGRYRQLLSFGGPQRDALHLALYTADLGMTTNDPFAARYNETALADAQTAALAELQAGNLRRDSLYVFYEEGDFLQAVAAVPEGAAWCGHIKGQSTDETLRDGWYIIAPGMAGSTFDELAISFDTDYPLRMADYTDALWNHGVLDSTKKTICFRDSPFTRGRLWGAAALAADGKTYAITKLDDHDAGWLMVTLNIEDATVLCGKELETING